MTYEQKQEAIKALVYGGTQEAAADAAGVPVYALAEITQAEIDEVQADLKEMGWLD
jgi:hypothetical protein